MSLLNLITMGLVDWEGANSKEECSQDSMHFAAAVTTHANMLQLQVSGLDSLLNKQSEDCQFLLERNAALEREVTELKQGMGQLEGEFGVLLARVESLEWVSPSEYLSTDSLLWQGAKGVVVDMSPDTVLEAGLCQDFGLLVDRPDLIDTSAPLFPL
ncbi:hypothetical protein BDM02DRAFT_3207848 [Thelephora ganbajun]|uniref:Uncharacterized protein n=1 Tax=Thelephora ganbajun TaxID=370292 RepID=A0ACB6Z6T5_THEGA|nr:hypothetical protein BDM02DRAFT_3207848 [Thelephora ganbajun]